MRAKVPASIEEYLSLFSDDIQHRLTTINNLIVTLAPKAKPCIKYGIPTYVLNGNLIHYAAYSKHIGIYPVPQGDPRWVQLLAPYKKGKGTFAVSKWQGTSNRSNI